MDEMRWLAQKVGVSISRDGGYHFGGAWKALPLPPFSESDAFTVQSLIEMAGYTVVRWHVREDGSWAVSVRREGEELVKAYAENPMAATAAALMLLYRTEILAG